MLFVYDLTPLLLFRRLCCTISARRMLRRDRSSISCTGRIVRRTGALLSRYDSQTCQISHICGLLSWPGCWQQVWSLSVCRNGGCAHLLICRLDQIAGLSDLQIHRFADRCPGQVAGVRTTVLVWLLATGLVVYGITVCQNGRCAHLQLRKLVRFAHSHICRLLSWSDCRIYGPLSWSGCSRQV